MGESAPKAGSELEQIRRAHFTAENNVKVLGVMMMIGAFAVIIFGLTETGDDTFAKSICVGLGAVLGLGGWWLRRLDVRGRGIYTGVTIFAGVIVLFALVSGKLDSAPMSVLGRLIWPLLFLAAVWSSKATTVMSEHYRDVVIPATPQVKRKISPMFIVAMVLLLLVIAASIFAAAIE